MPARPPTPPERPCTANSHACDADRVNCPDSRGARGEGCAGGMEAVGNSGVLGLLPLPFDELVEPPVLLTNSSSAVSVDRALGSEHGIRWNWFRGKGQRDPLGGRVESRIRGHRRAHSGDQRRERSTCPGRPSSSRTEASPRRAARRGRRAARAGPAGAAARPGAPIPARSRAGRWSGDWSPARSRPWSGAAARRGRRAAGRRWPFGCGPVGWTPASPSSLTRPGCRSPSGCCASTRLRRRSPRGRRDS